MAMATAMVPVSPRPSSGCPLSALLLILRPMMLGSSLRQHAHIPLPPTAAAGAAATAGYQSPSGP